MSASPNDSGEFLFSPETMEQITEAERRGFYTLERIRAERPQVIDEVLRLRVQWLGVKKIAKLCKVADETVTVICAQYADQLKNDHERRVRQMRSAADALVEEILASPGNVPWSVEAPASCQLYEKAELLAGRVTARTEEVQQVDIFAHWERFIAGEEPSLSGKKIPVREAELVDPALAPLRPGADQSETLRTQIYQAILERRSAPIIPRLKEILAKPDPALGYFNGELRIWLGWAQEVGGDHAGAQESWRQARSELEAFLKDQPENYTLLGDLALTNMGLGDKGAAFALTEQAMAAVPIEKDAYFDPTPIEVLARLAAQMGEPNRAIAAHSRVAPARSDVRSAPERSALRKNRRLPCAEVRLANQTL